MPTTDKTVCQEIASLLVSHGVRHAILSPGSRNLPMIVAINRNEDIKSTTIIDERTAAFVALGLAAQLQAPVALVCTSGTAVLNYAPAIAEAYYRQVPLIVISADRPLEWIDQDDSQTIRQHGALGNFTKGAWSLPVELNDPTQQWYINRSINDALLCSLQSPRGPVHINVHLDAPLARLAEPAAQQPRTIHDLRPRRVLPVDMAKEMAAQLDSTPRVLIIAGFMEPNAKVNRALRRLGARPNVVVMQEAQSNLHGRPDEFICHIDSVLSILSEPEKQELAPDLVITLGGSLVSRFVKAWLRNAGKQRQAANATPLQHWHVGTQAWSVDCFQALTMRISMDAQDFFPPLAGIRPRGQEDSHYRQNWLKAAARANYYDTAYFTQCPWSDYKAMGLMMKLLPERCNLHLSNGTAVRYAQLFDYSRAHRIDSNRGVSGIDGCTSTAVGASMAYQDITLLITGDMSAQYDVGALALRQITPRFKMVVLNNGGGGIFRMVFRSESLPERDSHLCSGVNLPVRQLAQAYGFAYYEAASEPELLKWWRAFIAEDSRPAILNVVTSPEQSGDALLAYFQRATQD